MAGSVRASAVIPPGSISPGRWLRKSSDSTERLRGGRRPISSRISRPRSMTPPIQRKPWIIPSRRGCEADAVSRQGLAVALPSSRKRVVLRGDDDRRRQVAEDR